MSKIPTEILIEIFKFLHFQEKLECMLVCRSWAQALRGYLLETVEISVTSSLQSFDRRLDLLLKHAKNVYQPGRNCKRLRIGNTGSFYRFRGINGAKIATSFPNLNFFQFTTTIDYDPKARSLRSAPFDSDPYVGWRKSLEVLINEYSDTKTFLGILTTGVFSRLTTLTVLPKFGVHEQSYYKWFSNLKNTPALTTFTIDATYLSITNLEELHKITPKLTSLNLCFGFRASPGDPNSFKITPAEKIKVFKITDSRGLYNINTDNFLQYAKMKYTNMEEFYYSDDENRSYPRDAPNVFSRSAWPDFISAIGPGLSKLGSKRLFVSNITLGLIEEYAIGLEYLDVTIFNDDQMLQKLMPSQTFYGLVSLTLRRLPLSFKMTGFRRLTKLKELYLDFTQQPLLYRGYYYADFASILNKLPKNIETLCLQSVNITSIEAPTQGNLNVINFKLYSCTIEDVIIIQHFPMLKSLILDDCRLDSKFELPNHHLHYLEIKPANMHTTVRLGQKYIKVIVKEQEKRLTHLRITVQNQTITYKLPVEEVDYKVAKGIVSYNDRSMKRVLKASAPDSNLKYLDFTLDNVDTVIYCDYLLL